MALSKDWASPKTTMADLAPLFGYRMGKGSTRTTGPYASKARLNRSPLMSTGTPVTYAAQAGCGSRGRAGGGCSAPPQRPMSGHRPAPGIGGGGGGAGA